MKWDSINFLWKFNIIYQRNFLGEGVVSFHIVHEEKEDQFP